ncbi:hypothetical protein [Mangrovimonas yunxiaonensis]|nr:hypothetical protein [Mangrovimonas yunxiaonensis]
MKTHKTHYHYCFLLLNRKDDGYSSTIAYAGWQGLVNHIVVVQHLV